MPSTVLAKEASPLIIGGLEKRLLLLPEEVRYCTRCVVSNQRPLIKFDAEGVCNACRFTEEKYRMIDWRARELQLRALLDKHRRTDGTWDVIVPCSGGKDSAYVAHQLKTKYGMHPLTVTWAPFRYTDIGFQNFTNFVDAGFNNLMAWPNGRFHRKLARLCFEELGDAWQPFAYGQMCYAFHIALRLGVPLVFFGENGEAEYGGDPKNKDKPYNPVDDWAMLYFKGTIIDDIVAFGLKHKPYLTAADVDPSDLTFYRPPPIDALQRAGVQMHWYSYYHKWVPQENYYYSVDHTGLCANPERSEGTYSKYASLDDRLDGFHFYLAFIKFGMGRTTQDAAHEIRDGHLTREEGVALVRRFDGEFPAKYFKDFLEYLEIDEERFWKVVDAWRRPNIWARVNGEWKLRHQVS